MCDGKEIVAEPESQVGIARRSACDRLAFAPDNLGSRTGASGYGEKSGMNSLEIRTAGFLRSCMPRCYSETPTFFVGFGNDAAEFLCTPDGLAERGDSNPRYSF